MDSLNQIFEWFRDEDNRGAAWTIFSILAALVVAGWSYFVWIKPQSKRASTPPIQPPTTPNLPPPPAHVGIERLPQHPHEQPT